VEYDLLVWDMLFYIMTDYIFENTVVSILATYIMDWFVVWIRRRFGTSNLADQAAIDQRFLL